MIKVLPMVLEGVWLPTRSRTAALPIWPFVLVKGSVTLPELRRALIFARQQSELFVLPFFLLFAGFWLLRLVQTRSASKAWTLSPFVREVSFNKDDPAYLVLRPRHAWRQYADLS